MNAQYIVISADNDSVTLTPLDDAKACAGCSGNCTACSVRFSVANSRHLDVKPGQKVKIGMSARHEALQGILSLVFPILCAVGGFFAAQPIASLFGKTVTEGMQAFCVLVFLAAACIIVLLITRHRINPEKLEITEIC
ncbi:MAG: SoxR reducing system RseC family protein [Treponema sp.]|nr:SoxR reducing system RseC family protein [Treponema sp.]